MIEQLGGVSGLLQSPAIDDIEVIQPQNGDTARLLGLEIGINHQLDWLPGFLSNLGFNGNVTLTSSRANFDVVSPATEANPFGGLEDDEALVVLGFAEEGDGLVRRTSFFNSPNLSANASLFYEDKNFEAAISATFTGRQFDFVDDFGLDQFNGRYYQLDFFMQYHLPFGNGAYSVYFEVPDFTDNGLKPTDLQQVGRQRLRFDEASFNGREFRFGLRGRF